MSQRAARQQTARAEARRRARLAAQGRDAEPDEPQVSESAPSPGGSIWQRILPAAPPLPGKGDPLAGFAYSGRAKWLFEPLYLLRRNPLAWLLPGAAWLAVFYFGSLSGDRTVALVSQLLQYGSLIAAGWYGWQRPWLFGTAAAFVGWLPIAVLYSLNYVTDPNLIAAADGVTPGQVTLAMSTQTLLQILLGAVAGFYGGYLRRRIADQRPRTQGQPSRRRR